MDKKFENIFSKFLTQSVYKQTRNLVNIVMYVQYILHVLKILVAAVSWDKSLGKFRNIPGKFRMGPSCNARNFLLHMVLSIYTHSFRLGDHSTGPPLSISRAKRRELCDSLMMLHGLAFWYMNIYIYMYVYTSFPSLPITAPAGWKIKNNLYLYF